MKVKGKRILVVDDELPIQRILRRNLSVSGYDVLVADDGEQAVEMARAHQPDLLRSEDGYLYMHVVQRLVRAGEHDVRLTPTEFELLRQLMLNAGKVLTHRTLLRAVWGPEYGEEADYLRVYVRQLRLKVETEPSRPRYIITEPGIGYVFRGNVITQEL